MIIKVKEIITEARAIDRRIDALNKGIVPRNGNNWNADRKNPNKISKALNLSNQAKTMDGEITKRNGISNQKEYGGQVVSNKLNLDRIGSRRSVESNIDFKDTFHKHPALLAQRMNIPQVVNSFKNNPKATPSGNPSHNHINGAMTDYGVNATLASHSPNNKKTEYIVSPDTKSNTISKLDTTILPDNSARHKLSQFSNEAKKYYDLNGNLINDANGYNPTKKNLFFKDKDISSKINNLINLKKEEQSGFRNKNLDINTGEDKNLGKALKKEGLKELRLSQPSLTNANYLSNNFANASEARYQNQNNKNIANNIISTINKTLQQNNSINNPNMLNMDQDYKQILNDVTKKKQNLDNEILPEYDYRVKK